MAWVEFVDDFDWDPPELGGRVTKAFRKGQVCFVRRLCAEAALAAGQARKTVNPWTAAHGPTEPEESAVDGETDAGRR